MSESAAGRSTSETIAARQLCRGLIGISLLFLLWRGPVMYREPGGMDECYAVPGLAILQDGLPRMPHAPAKNPESVFYQADVLLFSEPPLSFYYQALFYALLPEVYGTCRLSSVVAGWILFFLMADLARSAGLSVRAILWGVGLYSLSRWYFFLAIAGRPDILCTMFGLAACVTCCRWEQTRNTRWLVATGLAIGAGGLTHPFAIVYAVQIGVWILWSSRGWQRLTATATVTAIAIAVASLWLILIVQQPQIFQIQFRNQFLSGESGLLQRLLWPWESLAYHFRLQSERTGAIQFAMAIMGWLTLGYYGWRDRNPAIRRLWWLTTTAVWIIAALIGTHHPVFGYWTYPAALAFLGLGLAVDRLFSLLRQPTWAVVGGLVIVALMMPGSGIRTLVTHLRNWNDINYNAPQFAKMLMTRVPTDAVCMVDVEYAVDFLAAGRKTLMSETLPMYFRSDQFEYDYLIISRPRIAAGIAEKLDAELLETHGIRDDVLACYAEIYVPRRKAALSDVQQESIEPPAGDPAPPH